MSKESGITFRHTDGSSGRRYLMEAMSAGLTTFDYDGDGLIDVYFVNGAPLPGLKWDGPPPRNALYRNLGNFRFVDVTEEAGVGDPGFGLGATVGDYDNDGDQDLYVSNFGPNVLYRNRGDGAFEDVTRQAGVGRGNRVGAGVAFLDMDGDGDLDLFAANYIHFSFDTHRARTVKGLPVYPGPFDYSGEPDCLFRNNGDGTFVDVSVPSRIAARPATGMGVICTDYNRDGRTDIFVANDEMQNFLYRNQGDGTFDEVGLTAGVAFDSVGARRGNMAIDAADCDHNGWLDFIVTAYQREPTMFYRNQGDGFFSDATPQTGAGIGSINHVKWGVGLVDFDNDGYRDAFIACGHIDDCVELLDDTTSYLARNVLLRGDGRFVDVSADSGDGMAVKLSSRGAAFDDLDNDGRIDVVVLNSRTAPSILRNESVTDNHWIQLQLRGTKTNRDGVGARVRVVAGDLDQIDEVHSGRGYQSHWGTRLHFGLGKRDRVDRIEIHWIGGGVDVLKNLSADRLLTITEGRAQAASPQ
jgi:hypothetical protein